MKNYPSVTIGIPVYNEAKNIGRTLDSILNQSYPNLHILISDNCSTDNTVKIVKNKISSYPNSKCELFEQKTNLGAYENFKFLFERNESNFFGWLGAHDYVGSDYVEKLMENLVKDGVSLSYTDCEYVSDNNEVFDFGNRSPIHLNEENPFLRAIHVYSKLKECYPFYGIYNLDQFEPFPLWQVPASDRLILFAAAINGVISYRSDVQYSALRNEIKETFEERIARYHSLGVHDIDIHQINKMELLANAVYTLKSKRLNIVQKLKLLIFLKHKIEVRYSQFGKIRYYNLIGLYFKKRTVFE